MFFKTVEIPKTYFLIDTPRKLAWLASQLNATNELAFDIETTHPTVKNKEKVREYRRNYPIYIAGISFAWNRAKVTTPWTPGYAAYIPLVKADEAPFWGSHQDSVLNVLKEVLEGPVFKVAHNGKFDCGELFKRTGIKTNNFWFDTMLAHAMLDEDRIVSSHALKSDFDKTGKIVKLGISDAYLDTSASNFKEDLGDALTHYDPYLRRYSKVPMEVLYPYACADADLTLSLRHVFFPMLEAEGSLWVFMNIAMKLSHAIMLMELHGCPLNIAQARQVEKDQKAIMAEMEPLIYEIVGKEFNVASNQQLGSILFEYLGIPGGTRNKHGWVVDAEMLEGLGHPVVEPLLKYRKAQKIQSTYATAALDLVQEITNDGQVGWVHPQIWLDSVTGRLKCQDPNLTNLPRPENGGNIVKGMWQGGSDYVFLFKDYSQIEMRVAAHLSGEPVWVEGFKANLDMHAAMAKLAFNLGCSVDDVKKLHKDKRSKAKSINFGILYGESIFSLAQSLGIDYQAAEKLINEDYFGNAPTLKKWIDDTHAFVEQNGYVSNMFGRIRHLPNATLDIPPGVPWPGNVPTCYRMGVKPMEIGLKSANILDVDDLKLSKLIKQCGQTRFFKCINCPCLRSCFVNGEVKYLNSVKNRSKRQSVNYKVQGGAADMTSTALIWVTEELKNARLRSAPVLYIHDELGCYTHVNDVEATERIMEDCMVRRLHEFIKFSVPLVTDTEIVRCWGDKK